MKAPGIMAGVTAGLLLTGAAATALVLLDEGFPHADHQGLFPLCASCHQASPTSDMSFPDPETCRRCHDGEERERVDWVGPEVRTSNLDFDHRQHERDVAGAEVEAPTCQACHRLEGATDRMEVGDPRPESCLSCHAHRAETHLASTARCESCHLPLTRAVTLSTARIAALPTPPSHEAGGFLLNHAPATGEAVRCATCHARESCERCHLNAGELEAVGALERDHRVAGLTAGEAPHYPEPATHDGRGWLWEHGVEARSNASSCANCHARPSCRSCHGDAGLASLEALPSPTEDDPRGVRVDARATPIHDPDFATGHKIQASAMEESCASCHQPSFCVSCHAGAADPGFHLPDFMSQHATEAYGSETDCASCHNPEVFCRSCHAGSGLASRGRLDGGFHNGRPFWLLEHGEAARRGLEGCTTCHSQVDCTRCHSARGGWGVNPHGPGFEARRLAKESPLTCLRCHLGNPLGGGG